jgi:hypothetical protein
MTSLYKNKNFIFSISIKILYLFIFLSCFFYIIVEKEVTHNLSNNIANIFSNMYESNYSDNDNIKNNNIIKYYTQTNLKYSELEDNTLKYNNLLYFLNICFIVFLIIVPIIIYYISKVVYNKDIPVLQILLFNLIIYSLVGLIEYIFFINIASKYIPVTNGDIVNVIKSYFLK